MMIKTVEMFILRKNSRNRCGVWWAGPGVYICDECIELCQEIIEEEFEDASEFDLRDIPKPQEIYTIPNQYVIGQDRAKNLLL